MDTLTTLSNALSTDIYLICFLNVERPPQPLLSYSYLNKQTSLHVSVTYKAILAKRGFQKSSVTREFKLAFDYFFLIRLAPHFLHPLISIICILMLTKPTLVCALTFTFHVISTTHKE